MQSTINFCRNEQNLTALSAMSKQFRHLAEKDELTGLYNRRAMRNYIDMRITQAGHSIITLSVIMLDIDYFKRYNDHYGHTVADHVLVQIGQVLGPLGNDEDIFCARYGGEEFIALIINHSEEEVYRLAQRIKQQVDALQIEHDDSPISKYVTISCGISHRVYDPAEEIADYISTADRALYQAKNKGRNQIIIYNYCY